MHAGPKTDTLMAASTHERVSICQRVCLHACMCEGGVRPRLPMPSSNSCGSESRRASTREKRSVWKEVCGCIAFPIVFCWLVRTREFRRRSMRQGESPSTHVHTDTAHATHQLLSNQQWPLRVEGAPMSAICFSTALRALQRHRWLVGTRRQCGQAKITCA